MALPPLPLLHGDAHGLVRHIQRGEVKPLAHPHPLSALQAKRVLARAFSRVLHGLGGLLADALAVVVQALDVRV